MIVLNQDAISQGLSVIAASAEPDCPLLQRPKPGKRFSSVQDLRPIHAGGLTESRGQGGDAGKMLEEVERDALSHEE